MTVSLRVKLIFLIGSIIFIALSTSSSKNTSVAKQTILDAHKKHIEYITLTIGSRVESEIDRARTDIGFASIMPVVRKGLLLDDDTTISPDKKYLCDILEKLGDIAGNYETFYITSKKGLTIASNLLESVGVLDVSSRPWFYNTMLLEGTNISNPFISRISGEYLVAVSKRIEYEGAEGAMIGTLALSRILKPLLRMEQYPWLETMLVSAQGKIMVSLDQALQESQISEAVFSAIHRASTDPQFITIDGEKKLLVHHRIQDTGLYIVTLADNTYISSLNDSIRDQANQTLVLALLFAAVAVGLVLFPLTRDIQKLSTYAQEITEGNERLSTGVQRNDELGTLEKSLSKMVKTLKEVIIKSEEATKAKSEFLARMSHEIRTPMNSILGMTFLALQSSPPPKQQQFLLKIDSAAKNLLGIINDILDFSKMEAGKMPISPHSFNLRGMLQSIDDLFMVKCLEKKITLSFITDENVPDIIFGDALRISQLCINIINNALKFTEQGEITMRIEVDSKTDDNLMLHFSIADTGIGMTEKEQEKIFESFTQVDGSTTRRFGGTGLGLTICKLLVDLMHGSIWVESTLNVGSVFHFTIQVQEGHSDGIKTDSAKQTDHNISIRPMHILLVDDNEVNREIAMSMLGSLNCTCAVATNGSEAVQLSLTQDFDLILMDIQMPVMDGLTATRLIRQQKEKASLETIPIIAMTANAMSGDMERSLEAGMNDHITKPIDFEKLKLSLMRWQQ